MKIIEATTEVTHELSKRYRCRHLFIDGRRCGSPSLRSEHFCYYHHTTRGFADERRVRREWTEFELPPLEDRSSVLAAITEVLQRIAGDKIPTKQAGLLLYGLQIASLNLPETGKARSKSESESESEDQKAPLVEEVITNPHYGDLAPVAEIVEDAKLAISPRPISEQQDAPHPALEDTDKAPLDSPHPADPEPAILPNLDASITMASTPSLPIPKRVILSEASRSLIARGAVEGPAVAVAVLPPTPSHKRTPLLHHKYTSSRPERSAVERPMYFAVAVPASATNPPVPAKPEINASNPAPNGSACYPDNCHANQKRTPQPAHSAHRHQAAQRRRPGRRHAVDGLQLS